MALPPQNVLAWKVCLELLHIFAMLSTVYRLWYRWKISRMWWDDYLVVLPLILDLLYSTILLIRFPLAHADKPRAHPAAMTSYWLTMFLYLAVIWSTRIVLCLSLARVFPHGHIGRYVGIGLVVTYTLTFVSAVFVTTLTCKSLGFVPPKDSRCIHGIGGYNIRTLFLAFTDYSSDILIIVSSLALLWKIKLQPRERFLVLVVFSASSLTLLSAIVLTVTSFGNINLGVHGRFLFGMFMSLEVGVSLVVCNLAVVVTSIYRSLRRFLPSTVSPTIHETLSETSNEPSSADPSHLTFTDISSQRLSVYSDSISLKEELGAYRPNQEESLKHSINNSAVHYQPINAANS